MFKCLKTNVLNAIAEVKVKGFVIAVAILRNIYN